MSRRIAYTGRYLAAIAIGVGPAKIRYDRVEESVYLFIARWQIFVNAGGNGGGESTDAAEWACQWLVLWGRDIASWWECG